ncbi:phage tail tube protein [Sporolactobacillus terrae]|uniref:Phage major tail protein, TP901-1 family n=1 Tax=Sporolactobacillus terrae TaxID=269673 RepID=A0A5K7WV46_9BACL|nr:phage tail tube protein [Sporolactobacillus terrae]BBN97504.1 hypothetical protein St703_02090 [Sporolactobacillus terrae]
MAVAGKNSRFKVGTADIKGLNSGTVTLNGDTIDVTTFLSGGWIEKIQGLKSAELSLEGFWVSDDPNGQGALIDALISGDSVAVDSLLDGANGWHGSFLVTSAEFGAAVDGEVSASFSLESTGEVTKVTPSEG